jgi:CHASE2 domain-containing sensor protein
MFASAYSTPPPRPFLERLLIRQRDYRHPRRWLVLRLIGGSWNLFLGILMLSYGYWLGLLPLLASPVIFWAAYAIWTRTRTRTRTRVS